MKRMVLFCNLKILNNFLKNHSRKINHIDDGISKKANEVVLATFTLSSLETSRIPYKR